MGLKPNFKKKMLASSISSACLVLSLGATAQEGAGIEEEVIVTGVRAAQASAINAKRNAVSVVDGISSEDIGKLPDVTISDSLQRITGVQVTRTAGESGAVQIRGFEMVGTSLNGEEFLSATSISESTADFGDLPSQLMKGASVYKSPLSTLTTKGITGVVDLQTRRPFDMDEGFTFAGSAELDQGSETGENDPTITGLISWQNEKVGALVTFATTEKNLATNYNGYSDTSQDGGIGAANNHFTWVPVHDEDNPDDDRPKDDNLGVITEENYIVPQGFAAWNKVEERHRDGVNLSFQADLGSGFQLTSDYFYSEQERFNRRMGFVLDNRWQTFSNFAFASTEGDWADRDGRTGDSFVTQVSYVEEVPGGADITHTYDETWVGVNAYDVNAYRFKSFTQTNVNKEVSKNFNLQLDYDNDGALTGQVRLTVAEAEATMRHGYSEGDVLSIDSGARVTGPGGFVANQYCNNGEALVGVGDRDGDGASDGLAGCYADYSPMGIENGDFTLGYDASGNHPVFSGFNQQIGGPLGATATPTDYLANKDSYHVGAFSSEGNTDDIATLDTFSTKWNYEFDDSSPFVKSIDFGARIAKRTVDHDQFSYFSEFGDSNCGAQWKAVDQFTGANQDCQDGEWLDNPDFGTMISNPAARYVDGVLQPFMDGDDVVLDVNGDPQYPSEQIPAPRYILEGYTMLPPTRIDDHNNVVWVDDFGPVEGVPGVWTADPRDYDDPYAFHLRTFGNVQRVEDPGQTFDVDLLEHSYFLQTNFEFGKVTGNLGVKHIESELTIRRNVVGDGIEHSGANYDIGDEVTVKKYEDTLPSLNLSYAATDDIAVRFSAGKTMMPLNLEQWGGGAVPGRVFNNACLCMRLTDGGTQNGNPNLDPWRATNYDLTTEWYFGEASLFNVGYFKVDIDSFVTPGSVYLDLPDSDGVRRGPTLQSGEKGWRFGTNLQGEGGSVDGWEFASKVALSDFTDASFVSNLGFDVNLTLSDSESNEEDIFGGKKPFVGNSDTTYNVVAWFENDMFATRLAYNYRSERLVTWGSGGTGGQDLYQDDYDQLDFNFTYYATDEVSVYLNVSNIDESYQQAYVQFKEQKAYQNLYERRTALGVRATF